MALASLCNQILSRRNSFNNKKWNFFHCFFHKLTCTHYFNIRKCLLELQRKQNCVNSYTLFSKLKILNQSIDSSSFSSLMYISVANKLLLVKLESVKGESNRFRKRKFWLQPPDETRNLPLQFWPSKTCNLVKIQHFRNPK